MFHSFFEKFKKILVSLRVSILSIFVMLFVTAMLILITINYVHSSRTLLFTADKLMHEVSNSLYREFSREMSMALRDNELSAEFVMHDILNPNDLEEMTAYTLDLANRFYLVQATHWSDENGNYIIAAYEEDDDSVTSEIYSSKTKPPTHVIIHRNVKGDIIKKENLENVSSFDPRKRPWYERAKEAGKTVWTDIYGYEPNHQLGITLATPVYKNNKYLGTFGIDVRLDWLSWYIGEQKISPNGIIFIVTKKGEVIAYPGFDKLPPQSSLIDVNDLPQKWIAKSFEMYQKTGEAEFDFTYEGKEYVSVYKEIPHLVGHDWSIGIVVPVDDFTGQLKKNSLINIGISLVILMLGILVVSQLVTRVVNPLKNLVKETEKIKHFELEDEDRISSRIKEVMFLSNAIHAMKLGLKSFQKYVPASLVRQLIEADEHARIGGSKKQLVILFTDIKDFTTIAENMDPDKLMEHLCEYFDSMSTIIVEQKGTIDKFIGDSIMAFWGAPLLVDQPCQSAARAALKCERRLAELNANWILQDKNPLITRFGIHIGDAIVGNVGSSERMNYTAIGDSINMASRLEGVNKIYGTQIIVSEKVYSILKDEFVLRMVDWIAVKGKTKAEKIYELLAQDKTELAFDVVAYQKEFDQGFEAYRNQQWDEAIKFFKHCLALYPGDKVAAIFIERCQDLKSHPPEKWDGVWRMGEK
jgi:adenylate cyclase